MVRLHPVTASMRCCRRGVSGFDDAGFAVAAVALRATSLAWPVWACNASATNSVPCRLPSWGWMRSSSGVNAGISFDFAAICTWPGRHGYRLSYADNRWTWKPSGGRAGAVSCRRQR